MIVDSEFPLICLFVRKHLCGALIYSPPRLEAKQRHRVCWEDTGEPCQRTHFYIVVLFGAFPARLLAAAASQVVSC